MILKGNYSTRTGWEIIETGFDQDEIITTGSNFLIGNGYLGYRGTFLEWQADQYTACIVTDTYDHANGKWKELCNVPNGLHTRLFLDHTPLPIFPQGDQPYQRVFNLRSGTLSRTQSWTHPQNTTINLDTERFASFDQIHLIALQYQLSFPDFQSKSSLHLQTGIDGQVWSLQGDHFRSLQMSRMNNLLVCEARTVEENIQIVIAEGIRLHGCQPIETEYLTGDQAITRKLSFQPDPGETLQLEKVVAIYTSNDVSDPKSTAIQTLKDALSAGYQELKEKHLSSWEKIWSVSDIKISGNLEDQTLVRFNLYHNIIATPTHRCLPIGARGLSTQVYQGAAFWDQEIFNLPMFIYTQPEVAKNILKYRYYTLDGAKKKARRLGYRGAFFAWTSGKTGEELFPDFFFTDVLSGRKIRNHFNDWQIHISPDVVYAIWKYVRATGDQNFLGDFGAEIIFEVARFLYSHAFYKAEKDQYQFIRLLGPDEYHENVDNNAFTNYQAHFALQIAVDLHQELAEQDPSRLAALEDKISLTKAEVRGWRDMVERLYLPLPDPTTGLIEQFDGFFELEDITPEELKERLIHPDEYWGWPNGIAVHAQVLKQADVLQLLSLHDLFPKEVLQNNYRYYEPRTEHGSSLSPSVHAQVACKAGFLDDAYAYFKESTTIDLYKKSKKVISGGSFLGGIHTAACGAAWDMVIHGFVGFQFTEETLTLHPKLPDSWDEVEFDLIIRGQRFTIQAGTSSGRIKSLRSNTASLNCAIFEENRVLKPGEELQFEKK